MPKTVSCWVCSNVRGKIYNKMYIFSIDYLFIFYYFFITLLNHKDLRMRLAAPVAMTVCRPPKTFDTYKQLYLRTSII